MTDLIECRALHTFALSLATVPLALVCAQFDARGQAQGLTGLGPPGELNRASPKVLELESKLHGALNEEHRNGRPRLEMDEKLRRFARSSAARAVGGTLKAAAVPSMIESQKLAPFGYYFRFVVGSDLNVLKKAIRRDKELARSLAGDFDRIGIGAFHAEAEKPFFQVMIFLARDIDARAGQPGLSAAQTNPVMKAATQQMKRECYDPRLKKNPNFGGELLFELIIGAQGGVEGASLLRALKDDVFDACVLTIARTQKFPKPYKGIPVTLRHPVKFSPPQGNRIVGKLTDGQIRVTFATASSDFRRCYTTRVKALGGKKLKGRLSLVVTIAPNGEVTSVGVSDNTTADQALETCVLKRTRKLRFPHPQYGGPVTTHFPLEFGS